MVVIVGLGKGVGRGYSERIRDVSRTLCFLGMAFGVWVVVLVVVVHGGDGCGGGGSCCGEVGVGA